MERSYVLQLQESKFQEFYLAFCGYARCEPLHSFGPAVRPNYILHFVLEGKGTYQIGEQKYRISKGQGFLIEPDISVFYQADREHPWTYLWVGFGGTKAHKFVSDLGLNDERLMFSSRHGQELRRIVYSILKHTEFTVSNSYYLQSKLYEFFLCSPGIWKWNLQRRFTVKIFTCAVRYNIYRTIIPVACR